MTKHDWIEKIKKSGEAFIVYCTILGILSFPVKAYANYYIERAIDSKLIQLDAKVESLETTVITMDSKVDLLSDNIKHNTEVMDGLIKMLLEANNKRRTT